MQSNNWKRVLAGEVVEAELRRVKFLLLLCMILFVASQIMMLLLQQEFNKLFHGEVTREETIVIFSGLIGYYFVAFIFLRFWHKRKKRLLTFPRYINAFVEISLPTILLIVLEPVFGPVNTLLMSPALMIYFLIIIFSAFRLDFWLCVFTGFIAGLEYWVVSVRFVDSYTGPEVEPLLLSAVFHAERSILYVLAGVIAGLVTMQIKNKLGSLVASMEERSRVVHIFGQHVTPEVVDKLLEHKTESVNELRYVSVMFLDIRNFTTYAEKHSPDEVIGYLNHLFDFMIDCINKHHGIVNKFLGDGFMAVFGAPFSTGDDSRHAVTAAMEILEKLHKDVTVGGIPETRVGIGIHAGEALVGHVGSATRKEYTVIGDTVNVAARLEQLTKHNESQLLVSEEVWRSVEHEFADSGVSLGEMDLRGHEEKITIYKLA